MEWQNYYVSSSNYLFKAGEKMKVYLCSDHQNLIKQSGVGRAIEHQQMALAASNVPYTLAREEDYNIIHINTLFLTSYLKAKKAKKEGKKVVYHAHSTVEDFKQSFIFANALAPLFGWWLKKCYNTADLILTPSNYSKKLIENYALHPPVEVLSNGIDLDYWQATPEEVAAFREKYNIRSEDQLILSVGLPIKRKGILDFVEMAKQMPDVQFIWFGHSNPKLLPKDVMEAINTSLPNLQFPGYIDRNALRIAYQACDLYVFLTHEETEGIVLLEALASKTNSLVRDIPVFHPHCVNGENIYMGEHLEDFIEIARGILNQQLPTLTEAGYEMVSNKSIPKIGQQLKEYYQSLLD